MATETFDTVGLHIFTVPVGVTSITITAIGARGGVSDSNGGYGASITGTFSVKPSDQLAVLVGEGGGFGPVSFFGAGGGGGGSFVWYGTEFTDLSNDTLLVAAGGGGGIGWSSGLDASKEGNGVPGSLDGGIGGTNGNGGKSGSAGGGSGITGNGENGGISIYGGGTGGAGLRDGVSSSSGGGAGGFGGGGGGNIYYVNTRLQSSGGGGGGYSGGGGGGSTDPGGGGGGGGSYNADPNGTNIISDRSGNGIVTIHYDAVPVPTRGIPFF